jgi:RNA polymerase-binding transcription factor DksA
MTLRTLPAGLLTAGPDEARYVGGRSGHAWRTLLESRWGERLISVITLSLAYHDAAGQPPGDIASRPGHDREVRRLMRKTVAARRALRETEDAMARLSDGGFGQCEQCGAAIPGDDLLRVPETRYCGHCAKPATTAPATAYPPMGGHDGAGLLASGVH